MSAATTYSITRNWTSLIFGLLRHRQAVQFLDLSAVLAPGCLDSELHAVLDFAIQVYGQAARMECGVTEMPQEEWPWYVRG